MRELALFAGAGGGLLGSKLLGWQTVCAVEIDPYARKVLLARQRDGLLEPFPIWDDVCTFDGVPWRGAVDVVSGGFPCQDISSAGRGEGLAGSRSGLWREMLRVIGEVRPRYVFAENSPMLRTRGLGTVIEGLAGLGYDARWGVLGARHVGAPHRRDRMWIVAYAVREGLEGHGGPGGVQEEDADIGGPGGLREPALIPDTDSAGERVVAVDGQVGGAPEALGLARGERATANSDRESLWVQQRRLGWPHWQGQAEPRGAGPWDRCPDLARVDDGVAYRVDRTRATGNGQVPSVAALAWRLLSDTDSQPKDKRRTNDG